MRANARPFGPRALTPRPEDGCTALCLAAAAGHAALVEALLDAGARVDARDKTRWSPLHYASKEGHVSVVALLLASAGVAVDGSDRNGSTPLALALEHGQADVASLLLSKGADAAAPDATGRPASFWACTPELKELLALETSTRAPSEGGCSVGGCAPPSPRSAACCAQPPSAQAGSWGRTRTASAVGGWGL